ncbi:hypothetical protein ANN_23668 [Periplaneta americana]|uniref:Reverse transcriptase domain-containing protein n=1 Tax=Periplaneta americana TaxID=6978 RepID=A0ABQ8SM71_PERAM|nr:hypothetical protein ANN_23668 [Periplaneta americana]
MVFGEMKPRIRHRLPDICLTVGKTSEKPNQTLDNHSSKLIKRRKITQKNNGDFIGFSTLHKYLPMNNSFHFLTSCEINISAFQSFNSQEKFTQYSFVRSEFIVALNWNKNCGININGSTLNNVRFADDVVLFAKSPRELQSMLQDVCDASSSAEYVFRKVQDSREGLELKGLHQLLVYADDVNMLGENPQTIRENVGILLEASKKIGLEVNPEKTKYMIMSRDQNIVRNGNIKIVNLSFEEVEKFKYLGATLTNINDTPEEIKLRINMGNACYYTVEKRLLSSLLSKNLKFRIYKRVILTVVLYGCETWTLTLREGQRLRVFENKVLRKIFGAKRDEVTGEWRKLHNGELNALYSSPDIIRNIKSYSQLPLDRGTVYRNMITIFSRACFLQCYIHIRDVSDRVVYDLNCRRSIPENAAFSKIKATAPKCSLLIRHQNMLTSNLRYVRTALVSQHENCYSPYTTELAAEGDDDRRPSHTSVAFLTQTVLPFPFYRLRTGCNITNFNITALALAADCTLTKITRSQQCVPITKRNFVNIENRTHVYMTCFAQNIFGNKLRKGRKFETYCEIRSHDRKKKGYVGSDSGRLRAHLLPGACAVA